MNTWIMIADASRARLFETDGKDEPLRLVRELAHDQSRGKGEQFPSDKSGRRGNGQRGASAMDRPPRPKEAEAGEFAHQLAAVLQDGHVRNAFGQVALAAPPHFLGLLRGALDPQSQKRLLACIDKDFTMVESRDLPRRLQGVLDLLARKGQRQRRPA